MGKNFNHKKDCRVVLFLSTTEERKGRGEDIKTGLHEKLEVDNTSEVHYLVDCVP